MFKVAYVIRPAEGGMAQHLTDLIIGIDRKRFSPVLIAPQSFEVSEEPMRDGLPVFRVELEKGVSPLADASAARAIASALRKAKPDLIHVHGHKAAAITAAAGLFSGRSAPVVITAHNYPSYQEAGTAGRVLGGFAQRRISRGAAAIIAVSEDIRRYLIETEGVQPEKIITIHNGIDLSTVGRRPEPAEIDEARRILRLKPNDKVVGAIGRLVEFKGFTTLLEATAILKGRRRGFKTMIAGRGPEEQNLRRRIDELGIRDFVEMPGFLPSIDPFIAASDVFVVPSLKEPFGIIVLQAMAAGRPVVGAAAGGIPEIIRDGENGILVPPGDADALAGAVEVLLRDEKKAHDLAAAATDDVKNRFSVELMLQKTQEVYEAVLAGGRR